MERGIVATRVPIDKTRRACRRKSRMWRDTKSDKDLNAQLQAWGAKKKTQQAKDLVKSFKSYKKSLYKKYPQDGKMTPISNNDYVM